MPPVVYSHIIVAEEDVSGGGLIEFNRRIHRIVMLAGLVTSIGTFKYAVVEKVTFIVLNMLDLILTVYAVSVGFNELNPVMATVIGNPFQLVLVKGIIPVALAWLVPGKLLLPAIALIAFVIGWDIRELLVFLF